MAIGLRGVITCVQRGQRGRGSGLLFAVAKEEEGEKARVLRARR